jgi:hypothetical protein
MLWAQVGVIPLWARKAVCCQLELWERGLLWQHAATPLDANGGHVGLVHLLKVGKEVSAFVRPKHIDVNEIDAVTIWVRMNQ